MNCSSKIYTLDDIYFVGGQHEGFRFELYKKDEDDGYIYPFNAEDCTAIFSVIDMSGKYTPSSVEDGLPLLSLPCEICEGVEGVMNIATVEVSSLESAVFSGKYIYQLTVTNPSGESDVPGQGLLFVTKNIDRSIIN